MKTERQKSSPPRKRRKTTLTIVLPLAAIAILSGTQASHGDHSAPAANPSAAATSGSSSPPATAGSEASTKSPPLQGGVQKVELSLEKLRDVGLDLKHTLKAVGGLYDEVTIQPVTLITEPEVVGRGIIIQIPIGTQPVGPRQPARKDRVDLEMSSIRPEITLLKTNVDEFMSGHRQLDLPDDVLTELQPETKKWVEIVNQLSDQLSKLNQLTGGPPYDQDGIAAVAVDMQKEIKQLDETRRKIYKVIRKEGKRIAAARKKSEG